MVRPPQKRTNYFFEIGEWFLMGSGLVLFLMTNRPLLAGLMVLLAAGNIYQGRKEVARQRGLKRAILQPGYAVSEIILGDPIEKYKSAHFEYSDPTYNYYSLSDYPVLVAVDEHGLIDAIQCDSDCFWQDVNLIGLRYEEFAKFHPLSPDKVVPVLIQTEYGKQCGELYSYDALGLQLWIYKKHIWSLRARCISTRPRRAD